MGNWVSTSPESTEEEDELPPFLAAAKEGHLRRVEQFLSDEDVNVDMKDEKGLTALDWACKKQHLEIVRLLVESNANVNNRSNGGTTPLHRCWDMLPYELDYAELLIEHGADINAQNKRGETPLHWASQSIVLKRIQLLIDNGANIHAMDMEGHSPLHAASCHPEAMELLLVNGANINVRDNRGLSMLHWICEDLSQGIFI